MKLGRSAARSIGAKDSQGKEYFREAMCGRCDGLMITEPFFDLLIWRCVQCGERVDPVILLNREHRLPRGLRQESTNQAAA